MLNLGEITSVAITALALSVPLPGPGEHFEPIAGGALLQGSSEHDLERMERAFGSGDPTLTDYHETWSTEHPQRRVDIEPFEMARNPVTVAEFRSFVRATRYRTTAERCDPCGMWYSTDEERWITDPRVSWRRPAPDWRADDEEPVVQVSLKDARAYAAWRGARLPSVAEQEWAAWGSASRASSSERPLLPFPVEELSRRANFADRSSELPWAAREADDGHRYASPVCSFPPNEYGLCDMLGNVWEWSVDPYESYATEKPSPELHEMRGGAFTARPGWMRPTTRMTHERRDAAHDIGFRLAR